jgi:hypothetical protein
LSADSERSSLRADPRESPRIGEGWLPAEPVVLDEPRVSQSPASMMLATCDRARRWLGAPNNLLFTCLLLVHLVPIWGFEHLVTQDGPSHLDNAEVIRDYFQPGADLLRQYYTLNTQLTPNWLGHLTLAALLTAAPAAIAEKLFQSGYVLLLPISVRYAVSGVRRDSAFLALLAFPFIYNSPFHMGFYEFSYSLPVFFFVSGYWIKHREQIGFHQAAILGGLFLLLYLCHPVTLAAALLELALLASLAVLRDLYSSARLIDIATCASIGKARLLGPSFAMAPTLAVLGAFMLQRASAGPSSLFDWADKLSLKTLAYQLITLHSLVSYSERETFLSAGLVCVFAALSLYALLSTIRRRLRWSDGFLLLAIVYAAVYMAAPSEVDGVSYIQDRLNPFPFFALLFWLASRTYQPVARYVVCMATCLIAAAFLVSHAEQYRELNSLLDEYLSGESLIQENSTLLPIYFSQAGDDPVGQSFTTQRDLLLHASGYLALDRGLVDLGNYEAGQTQYFPTLFRPDLNPALHLDYKALDPATGQFRAVPTGIESYPRQTGGKIDYVILWGLRGQQRGTAAAISIFDQLHDSYTLAYQSSPRGLMRLYRRTDLQTDAPEVAGPRAAPVGLRHAAEINILGGLDSWIQY